MKKLLSIHVPFWGQGNPYQIDLQKALEDNGVEVKQYRYWRPFFNDLLLKRVKPDVIHLHWLPSYNLNILSLLRMLGFLVRFFLLSISRIKVVITAHNIIPHESTSVKVDLFFRKILCKCCHAVITHGESAIPEVVKAWGLHKNVIVRSVPHANYINSYPNTISKNIARQKLGIPANNLVFLYFGTIRPYKGVFELIGAFQELNIPDASLLIAGKPLNKEYEKELTDLVQNQNISLQLTFIKDDEVQTFMNSADVVVFPYKNVLTSGALLLAKSFGKAVIVPKLNSMLDVTSPQGALYYEPSDEPKNLNEVVNSASEKRANLASMGRYNFDEASAWGWAEVGKATSKVYEDITSS